MRELVTVQHKKSSGKEFWVSTNYFYWTTATVEQNQKHRGSTMVIKQSRARKSSVSK
jgi:hypothetical protein